MEARRRREVQTIAPRHTHNKRIPLNTPPQQVNMLSSITKSLASSYAMASPAAASSRASSKNAIHHHLPSMATLTQVSMEQACHTTLTDIALRALLSTPRPSLCSSKHCKEPPHTLLFTVCDSQQHHHATCTAPTASATRDATL